MKKTIARFLVSYPKLLLSFGVLFCVFFSFFANRLEVDASTQTLLLEHDKDLALWREISKRYESPNFLVISYTPKEDLLSVNSLNTLRNLSNELNKLDSVTSVFSILNAPLLQNKKTKLTELVDYIPSLEDEWTDKNLAKKEFLTSPLYKNSLVSDDFKTTAILINLKPSTKYQNYIEEINKLSNKNNLTKEQKNQLQSLRAEFKIYRNDLRAKEQQDIAQIRQIISKYQDDKLFLGGMNMIANDMVAFVRSDLFTYAIATLGLVILCLFLFYMQIRFVVVAISICLACIGAASGIFGILGFEITVISSNYIALQLIITLSIVIHLINAYREIIRTRISLSEQQIVYLAVRDRLSPCFFAVFTTAIGFLSLVVSDIRPVASLGIMMAASILLSFFIVFILFSSIMSLLSKKPINTIFEKYFTFTKYCAKIVSNKVGRIYVYITCLLAFCIGVFGLTRLEVENSFIRYFKENTEIYKGMAVIDKNLGGTIPLDIIIKFKPQNKITQELDEFESEFEEDKNNAQYWFNERRMSVLKKVSAYLKDKEFIGSVSSFDNLLQIGKILNENRDLDSLALALLYNNLKPEHKKLLLDPYVNIDEDELHFSLRTQDNNPNLKRIQFLNELEKELNDLVANDDVIVQISGVMKLYANMLLSLFTSQTNSILFVLLALFITFIIIFRSIKLSLIAIIVNIIPLVCVLGTMGIIGLPLDIMSITIASISLGIGVDDVIHYIHRYKIEFAKNKNAIKAVWASHQSIGYAMYYTSFAIFMGFGVMVSSNFWPTIYFGILVDLVMFFMLISALLLLPCAIISTQKLKF